LGREKCRFDPPLFMRGSLGREKCRFDPPLFSAFDEYKIEKVGKILIIIMLMGTCSTILSSARKTNLYGGYF